MRLSVHGSSRKRGISLSFKNQDHLPQKRECNTPRSVTPNIIYNKLPPTRVKIVGRPQAYPQFINQNKVIFTQNNKSMYVPPNKPVIKANSLPINFSQNRFSQNKIEEYERKRQQQILRQNLKREISCLNDKIEEKQQKLRSHHNRNLPQSSITPYRKINNQHGHTNNSQTIYISSYKQLPQQISSIPQAQQNQQTDKQINNFSLDNLDQSNRSIAINILQPKTILEDRHNQLIKQIKLTQQKSQQQYQQLCKQRENSLKNNNNSNISTNNENKDIKTSKKIIINQNTLKEMKKQEKQNDNKEPYKKSNTMNMRKSFEMRVFEELENKLDHLIDITSR